LHQLGEFYLRLKHLTQVHPRFVVSAVQLVD
jgi:hypothetical protein